MQVDHHIGVVRKLQEAAALALQLGLWRPLCQPRAHPLAHQGDVLLCVCAQTAAGLFEHSISQVGVVAVEVLTGVELKTAHRLVVQALRQTDRVGRRHQDHTAA